MVDKQRPHVKPKGVPDHVLLPEGLPPTLTPATLVALDVPERLAHLLYREVGALHARLDELQERCDHYEQVIDRLPQALKKRVQKEQAKCKNCGRSFVREGRGRPQKYCTPTCRSTAAMRRYRASLKREQQRAELLEYNHPDTPDPTTNKPLQLPLPGLEDV